MYPRAPRRPAPLLLLAVLLAAGCGDDGPTDTPPPPDTEVLTARVRSPTGIDGAVLLEMSSDEVVGFRVDDERVRAFAREDQGRVRIALVRLIPGGFTFDVLAVESPGFPEIQVVQVADLDNRLVEDVSDYSVLLNR